MPNEIAPTCSLEEHNRFQCDAIKDTATGAFSEKNMYYAWQFYKRSPTRTEAISYWILEARCGEKYRDEHPGPLDTSVPAQAATT